MELRYKSFRGFMDRFTVDIACFQEVKLPEARVTKELACVPGFQSFWATSTSKPGYSGVTTWCRCPEAAPRQAAADCLGGEEQPELDTEGRVVLTDHGAFVLINVYVPNAGDRPERARLEYKLAFLRALRRKMDELTAEGRQASGSECRRGRRALMPPVREQCPAEPRDVHAAIGYDTLYDERELSELRSMAAAYPDVWRRLHPEQEGTYTVWEERTSARAFNVGLRIDYVFVSLGLLPYVESCEVLSANDIPPKWSDHAALLFKLRVRSQVTSSAISAEPAAQEGSLPAEAHPEAPGGHGGDDQQVGNVGGSCHMWYGHQLSHVF
ncbi:hypothetical protein GPECTOR_6g558 [Gonium pectorale]|uniref:Endonuclease/exonuclease/phosphatase domain-containing protein n=1 Tax=Gonium pectorale TaxID=33097 RepID=A0A150GUY4_GONPE|nr:hypothetical protein GPECTOR_6g558 [Gonium pectorale]|eukprot:KXZ53641.1 hypothetical protein GPECTOR_6g558 [Gonium pectorale]